MMFLDCPAYLDRDGAVRCGLPAEVERRLPGTNAIRALLPRRGGIEADLTLEAWRGCWTGSPPATRDATPSPGG